MKNNTIKDAHFSPMPLAREIEATKYRGRRLTPIAEQNNASIKGTQFLDKDTYVLRVDGLVKRPLSLSYSDLQKYPQIPRLVTLDCVEGWNFTAKWTGPTLTDILDDAKVKPGAKIAIFHTADAPHGYSSLPLDYIYQNKIILALKDNDITLPQDRGFPFQVVAGGAFRWAKWVTHIELSADTGFKDYSRNSPYKAVFCQCDIDPWWWTWFPWWPWKK
jgi:DMSO/TMAO reductase YedYZ molybdopterin-dependent catalytic subunit